MTIKNTLLIFGFLSLLGCDAYSQFQLESAAINLREECYAQFTNSCKSKTIDFNIMAIKYLKVLHKSDMEEISDRFGSEGLEIYKEVEDEAKTLVIDSFKSMRPNWFARWFLGNAQPFDGETVFAIDNSHAEMIRDNIMKEFMHKLKKANLIPNKINSEND